MNLRIPTFVAAACGACALLMSSCAGPGYVGASAGYGPSRTYSNYTVTLADGYAGRGYYYGPPNTRYYSRSPGVVYYRTRESVPSQYWRVSSSTTTTRPSSYRPGYPGSRDNDRWDNDRDRRDGDRWDNDRRDGDRDRWDRDGRDRDDDDDRRGPPSYRR